MVDHICPRCGAPTEIPQLFSPMRQSIFNYIWNNPWCTIREIHFAIYGYEDRTHNAVTVHISRIKETLHSDGEYRVDHKYDPANHGNSRSFRIIRNKEHSNATANISPELR